MLSYILQTGTGRTVGRDLYGVVSRVFFTHVFGEGTQLPRPPMVTYSSKRGVGGGVLLSVF